MHCKSNFKRSKTVFQGKRQDKIDRKSSKKEQLNADVFRVGKEPQIQIDWKHAGLIPCASFDRLKFTAAQAYKDHLIALKKKKIKKAGDYVLHYYLHIEEYRERQYFRPRYAAADNFLVKEMPKHVGKPMINRLTELLLAVSSDKEYATKRLWLTNDIYA